MLAAFLPLPLAMAAAWAIATAVFSHTLQQRVADQLSDAADKITRLTGNEARIVDLHETDLDAPHLTDFIDDVTDEGITLHGEAGQLRSPQNRRRYERSA